MENQNFNNQPPPIPNQTLIYSTKAILSLVFGILGLVGFGLFAGVPAWVIGKMELDAIKRGESGVHNRGFAQAGFILGIISTALYILIILLFVAFWLIFGSAILLNMKANSM